MTIYLYVKTHRKTGLKYLGKTKQDPYKYRGSGKYWKSHIKVHGYDVGTEILRECQSNEEVKEWGLHYSNLWNIVESAEWANVKPEEGDGINGEFVKEMWKNDEFRSQQIAERKARFVNSEYAEWWASQSKKNWEDPVFRAEATERSSKQWDDPEYRSTRTEKSRAIWEDAEYREMMHNVRISMWEDASYRSMMTENSKKQWDNPDRMREHIERVTGENHPQYDHTIYHFINDNGTEELCTRYHLRVKYSLDDGNLCMLIKGKRKSHGGWRIKSIIT